MSSLSKASRQDWCTPEWVVEIVKKTHGVIDLDPCSNKDSIVGATVALFEFTDGLASPWKLCMGGGIRTQWDYIKAYVNPPFKKMLPWVEKIAHETSSETTHVILLHRWDPSTKWFVRATTLPTYRGSLMLDKRVAFLGADTALPFPCALSYFNCEPPKGYLVARRT